MKKLPFITLLTFATILIVGCGDDDKKGGDLTADQKRWIRQKYYEEKYGGNSTTTTTTTQVQYVTITNVNTVQATAQ
ncbi:MAG TPA: hypothetical protein VIH99_13275 [Bdellovibrionota bacterium]|jgi:hypothetical protein